MRAIKGYEGYFMDDADNVFSNRVYSKNPKGELRQMKVYKGMVALNAYGKKKTFRIARLRKMRIG